METSKCQSLAAKVTSFTPALCVNKCMVCFRVSVGMCYHGYRGHHGYWYCIGR